MFEWNQFGLQDAFSPTIEEFIFFHGYLILVLVFIITVVAYFIIRLGGKSFSNLTLLEGQLLESVWTVAPALVLIFIAVPSLTILYRLDSSYFSSLTLKVMGHQWYWSYEYSDFWRTKDSVVSFDAYMIPTVDLTRGQFRLLETDNRPVLPFLTRIRVLVRRADVLHSWAVPRAGVKLDATPGRLNQTSFISRRPGVAYGQCSEICGANHRFIPISLEFTRTQDFLDWVEMSKN